MDIVFIRALRLDLIIGVYDWERTQRQTLLLDLDLSIDLAPAAATDELNLTLDYKALCDRIKAYAEATEFQLLESLAERIAEICLREFPARRVRLTLHKPHAVSDAGDVGIIIERD